MSRVPDIDSVTEAALMAAYQDDAPHKEAEHRDKMEKKMRIRPDDGRRARATGRTKQFNCKMKPDLHKAIVNAAHKAGVSVTVWIERAALAYMGSEA
jgi:predicted HicB family RNase H-like nuclease